MTDKARPATSTGESKRRVTIERTYRASLEDIWELWTTKQGIEAWRGPDGFAVKVRKLDLRPGGALEYTMTATDPAQIEFVKAAGLEVTQFVHATYTEVVPRRRLAFNALADFIPGVEPYTVGTLVELHADTKGVRMVLSLDAMHDEQWTKIATMGWNSELDRLAKVLEG